MSLTLKTYKDMNIYRIKAKINNFFLLFAALTDSSFAQNAKKISIKKEKVSLKEALTEIENRLK